MNLANLVFEIVKDAIEIPNSSITFDSFIEGDFDDDRDFSSQISYAFKYINLAFARLRSLNKTLLKTTSVTPDSTGYIEFEDGEITAVVNRIRSNYRRISFYPYSDGIAIRPGAVQDGAPVFIEYRPNIPYFTLSDIRTESTDDTGETVYVEVEIDLADYGITDEMAQYVKEYASAGLMQYLSPDMSSQGIQMAEAHFAALKTRYTNYPQREIVNKIGSGGAW